MPGDRSWCDAYDLAGNVGEWVADWYASDYYISSPETDPEGPEGGLSKTYRGASWDAIGDFAYSSIRFGVGPQTRLDHIGMRLAQSVFAERGQ
jgi:formylglycine-generating enzyme required for sulfatase activity